MNKTVSFSQFSTWTACPYKWKLLYIDDVGEDVENINFVFGTAMHDTLQEYLTRYYNVSVVYANAMDLPTYLKDRMKKKFLESKNEKKKKMDVTKEEMIDSYYDGAKTLDWIKRRITKYFPKKDWTLVGVELPLEVQIRPGISFKGFLDVVLRDINGKIRIIDFKTSRMGWKDKDKNDPTKRAQLVMYKHYYSEQFGIPMDDITVEFIVLKRKIYENCEFPIPRVQVVEPPTGKVTVSKTLKLFEEFINSCFILNDFNKEADYPKKPDKKNCKWCKFNRTPHCEGDRLLLKRRMRDVYKS